MAERPVAVLAFSYDPQQALQGVHEELKLLEPMFRQDTPFVVEAQWKPSAQWIEDVFGKFSNPEYGDQIYVFHFSGHATAQTQQWNDEDDFGEAVNIFSGPLANYIGARCRNIRLVFLNACCTRDQAEFFIRQGAHAVIATTQPVGDHLATAFAVKFYSLFTDRVKRYTLQQAFDLAWQRLNFTDELIRRGSIDLLEDLNANRHVYELHFNPNVSRASVAEATFDQWSKVKSEKDKVTLIEDSGKLASKGVHPTAYLLCNRETQQKLILDIMEAKRLDQIAQPCFIAIHDEEKHCPQFMAEWLDWYGLKQALSADACTPQTTAGRLPACFKTLGELSPFGFQGSGDWKDPGNPARDLFKHELFHQYRAHFDGQDDLQQAGPALQYHTPEQFPLLIVHQYFDFEAWEESPQSLQNLETLLDFYLGDFSEKVLQAFSRRLVVLWSVKYWNGYRSQHFVDLFERLARQHTEQSPSRFYNLTQFQAIRGSDLNKWQQRQFNDSAFFQVGDILQKETPLSMFTTRKELSIQIERFNRQFDAHGG